MQKRNKSMKLKKRSRDTSRVSRRANGREKGRIGVIRDGKGVIKEKQKDFKRVIGKIKIFAEKAKGKKINTQIKSQRGRGNRKRWGRREKRNNCQRGKVIAKREWANKGRVSVMINCMKRIREKNRRRGRSEIKEIVSGNKIGVLMERVMVSKKIISVRSVMEHIICKETERKRRKSAKSGNRVVPSRWREKGKAVVNLSGQGIERERGKWRCRNRTSVRDVKR